MIDTKHFYPEQQYVGRTAHVYWDDLGSCFQDVITSFDLTSGLYIVETYEVTPDGEVAVIEVNQLTAKEVADFLGDPD